MPASPDWVAAYGKPLTPADLPLRDCISVRLPNSALFRWSFQRDGEPVQIEAPDRLTLNEAAVARTAVLDGAGIGFFIEQDVAENIAAGHLVGLLDDWTPPRPGSSLYYPGRRNPSAGFTAFRNLVRHTAIQDATVGECANGSRPPSADQAPPGGVVWLLGSGRCGTTPERCWPKGRSTGQSRRLLSTMPSAFLRAVDRQKPRSFGGFPCGATCRRDFGGVQSRYRRNLPYGDLR